MYEFPENSMYFVFNKCVIKYTKIIFLQKNSAYKMGCVLLVYAGASYTPKNMVTLAMCTQQEGLNLTSGFPAFGVNSVPDDGGIYATETCQS